VRASCASGKCGEFAIKARRLTHFAGPIAQLSHLRLERPKLSIELLDLNLDRADSRVRLGKSALALAREGEGEAWLTEVIASVKLGFGFALPVPKIWHQLCPSGVDP
jgi:hypothetical protein